MPNLSGVVTQLLAQRKAVQQELGRLDKAIAVLRGLEGRSGARPALVGTRTRVKMSAGARRKISQAKKAWWAKKSLNSPARPTLSLVARRKIAAAQRARWAKWKAKQPKAA